MERKSFRFPPEVWEHLEDEARLHGMSPSEFARLGLVALVAVSRAERGAEPERSMRDLVRELSKQQRP